MTYTEEEIKKYTNILQNFNDGLDVNTVREEYLPPKFHQKASCNNWGNTHFFKDKGTRYCNKYTLFDGFTDNTRGYFTSYVVFFRAPQGRGKIRATSKMSASIICKTIE